MPWSRESSPVSTASIPGHAASTTIRNHHHQSLSLYPIIGGPKTLYIRRYYMLFVLCTSSAVFMFPFLTRLTHSTVMSQPLQPSSPHPGASSPRPPSATGEKTKHREQPRIRRRNRLITSCLECRRRKLRCDKQQPCTNCEKFSRDCLFITPALDAAGQAKLAEVKEKMGMLEKTLEEDVARRSTGQSKSPSTLGVLVSTPLPGQGDSASDQEDDEDVKGLEPTSLAVEDCAYYEEEGNDDVVDLGISMGRLRVTERIGGFVRPRFSEELAQGLQALHRKHAQNPFAAQSQEQWMAPSRDYVAPSSGFFFAPGIHKTSLTTYLPSQGLVDRLMDHYWKAVHVIARTVHRPSFERHYDRFWTDIAAGVEPRASFQAVLFAALLSSVISMSEEKLHADFGVAKTDFVENFKLGTEAALARANFLRTTKLETIQAFVMYLIPLCRAEVSRAHSALVGTCIRLAECMGLHRDPSFYTSDPVEIHVRRLIWHQICFLDIRTCESTGPRPQIRRDEHDTKFPLNVDDVDLESGVEITEDRVYFTDMTITRMRFECNEMQRQLWVDRPRLEAKKTTLTALLSKIQNFCQAMERKWLPLLNKSHPLHVLAMEIYGILSCRMYIMILQKFASNEHRLMPERLRQLTISTALRTLENSMTIEETPALADWAWYIGALHQYHTALLLLSEVYAKERDPVVEARVWRCLDFVFGLPSTLSNAEKLRMVLEELVERTRAYQSARRFRAPARMEHVGRRQFPGGDHTQHEGDGTVDRGNRSSSVHSGTSSFSISSGGSPSHYQPHQQSLQQPQHTSPHLGNLGQIAQAEYGAPFGLSGADTSGAMSSTATDAHGFTGFPPGQPSVTMSMPPLHQSMDPNGSSATMHAHAQASGGSPMDTMPEIDWVSSHSSHHDYHHYHHDHEHYRHVSPYHYH
ncbi:uncharacterized protein EI97DRAFT_431673 [Westerdykella ornata]|uniref:Zn(2)-C6 fungal-type domain-containing protein n=1 Tax=Westerdykella ornata TaxID=318751 RepID=A0A6A6JQS3_WESOR|nr:uncharacterized protein EI97DRAFT_431673 [Westerdykella ornata]KAF2278453.1 hypothetical protein EI97DRAFT_431673 [Westerdykella ornata]